jgi:type IV secretion system protein TrbE
MIFNELRLPKFKRKVRHGTPELLPYSHLVANGVVMLKDGSLLRSYRMYGPDLKAATMEQLLAVKHHGNAALTRLADGWMVQSDLTRFHAAQYISGGPLPDPITQLIENKRAQHYQAQSAHLETALSMSITYRPPSETENRARRLFFTDPAPDDERNLQYFVEATDALANDLGAHLRLEAMSSDEALSFYESCIIGEQVRLWAPKIPNYLDTFVGRHRLVVSRRPTIGGRAIRVVIPTGLPLESHAEVVDFLCNLPFPYRYSVRAVLLGTQNAGRVVSNIRMKHHQKTRRKWDFLVETTGKQSTPTYLNEHAVNMAKDATIAAAEAESNQVREVYLSFGVVITDPDPTEADQKAETVRALFSHHRFNARIEDFNTVEAWRGFVPGDGCSNRRKPVVSTMNVADFTPMRTTWTGALYNPNPMYPPRTPPLFYATTEGQTPFRFHLHAESDVGHGAILGPTGMGKTTLADFMIAQSFKIPEMQAFVFDRGLGSYLLTKAAGGQHWHLGNDPISAAPLINIDQEIEREWAHSYITALLRLALNRALSPLEDEALWRALELLANRPRHFRTITALQGLIQDSTLKAALTRYTLKGPMGRYLDATEDTLLDSRFATFELETIQNTEALIPVLLYLFHRVDQRLNGRPTLIVIDEAALLALINNTVFGQKIEDWYRSCRSRNAAVWLLTQSLDDLRRCPYKSVILESAASKVYLANPEAQTHNMLEVYRDFGLNEKQIELIASEMIPKRHYLLVSPAGCSQFDLELDPVTLAFVGASSKQHIQRARELIAQYGEAWPAHWLRERGLFEAAQELERSQPHEYTAAAD